MQGVPTIGADGSKKEYGQRLLDAGCSHWRPVQDDIPIPGKLNIINLFLAFVQYLLLQDRRMSLQYTMKMETK